MRSVELVPMTRELCHTFFRDFERDPAIYMDMDAFSEYRYDPAKADAYFDSQQISNRIVFMVLLNKKPIGEVKLKNIDIQKRECTLGIHLQNDSVKDQGLGTEAERLALEYAFTRLGMDAVNADAVQKNKRSQHVLEKVGFRFLREDEMFRYYRCERDMFQSSVTFHS